MIIEVDVWIRGTDDARTHCFELLSASPDEWDEIAVRQLVSEMLLALDRAKNPGADPPPVSMHGFSWIVSAYDGGVIVHLELQTGTVSAGPFAIDEARLTELISRVMQTGQPKASVH